MQMKKLPVRIETILKKPITWMPVNKTKLKI